MVSLLAVTFYIFRNVVVYSFTVSCYTICSKHYLNTELTTVVSLRLRYYVTGNTGPNDIIFTTDVGKRASKF